jgi:hypothetical protein
MIAEAAHNKDLDFGLVPGCSRRLDEEKKYQRESA